MFYRRTNYLSATPALFSRSREKRLGTLRKERAPGQRMTTPRCTCAAHSLISDAHRDQATRSTFFVLNVYHVVHVHVSPTSLLLPHLSFWGLVRRVERRERKQTNEKKETQGKSRERALMLSPPLSPGLPWDISIGTKPSLDLCHRIRPQ